jgi:nucleoid-associated protein YgaU
MNGKQRKIALLVGLQLLMGACSTSQPKDADGNDIIPASTDAGTDAVPQPTAENPPPPGGDNPGVPPDSSPSTAPPDTTASASPSTAPPAGSPDPAAAPGASPASPTAATATTPDPAPVAASAAATGGGGTDSYTVQDGDTLMKIAFDTYGDVYKWKDLYDANKDKISNPNSISKGLVLKIDKPATAASIDKNGDKYLIKKGDTLGKISGTLYGTQSKWKELWENNKQLIRNPNKIFAGFYLYYVNGGGAKPQDTTTSPQPLADAGSANPAGDASARTPTSNAAPAPSAPAAGAPAQPQQPQAGNAPAPAQPAPLDQAPSGGAPVPPPGSP